MVIRSTVAQWFKLTLSSMSTSLSVRPRQFLSIEVDPSGADAWKLKTVIELLKQGAVGVIPTDSVYAIACDCKNPSAVERLRRIKKIESSKVKESNNIDIFYFTVFWDFDDSIYCYNLVQPLSILCRSFRDIDTYTMGFPRGDGHGHANVFRAVKQCLPGPVCETLFSTAHVLTTISKTVFSSNGIMDMTGPYPKIIRGGKGPILPWMVVEDDDDSRLRQDLIASGT